MPRTSYGLPLTGVPRAHTQGRGGGADKDYLQGEGAAAADLLAPGAEGLRQGSLGSTEGGQPDDTQHQPTRTPDYYAVL